MSQTEKIVRQASGANRSDAVAKLRFDLIPPDVLDAVLSHAGPFGDQMAIAGIGEVAAAGHVATARELYAAYAAARVRFALNAARFSAPSEGRDATILGLLAEAFLVAFRMADPAAFAARESATAPAPMPTAALRYFCLTRLGYEGMKRLAATFHEGAEKYGVFNWRKGFAFDDTLNHALGHLDAVAAGDESDPQDIGHAIWNIAIAAWSWVHCPHLNGHIASGDVPIFPPVPPKPGDGGAARAPAPTPTTTTRTMPGGRAMINGTIARDLAFGDRVDRYDEGAAKPADPAELNRAFRDPTGRLADEAPAPAAP